VDGLRISLPRTGSAARIYFAGFSDPMLAAEISRRVPRGGCYVDVGAHVGEYVLLAAQAAGPDGTVVAFEPNPDLAAIVEANAELNSFPGIRVRRSVVGAVSDPVRFSVDQRSGGGWIGDGDTTRIVDSVTLAQIAESERLGIIDVVKIDAAGAELGVIRGGLPLMAERRLPLVIAKLYHREVVRERFGVDSLALPEELLAHGYRLEALTAEGRHDLRHAEDAVRLSDAAYSVVLIARSDA
jgi:FkbM family methyltransferase